MYSLSPRSLEPRSPSNLEAAAGQACHGVTSSASPTSHTHWPPFLWKTMPCRDFSATWGDPKCPWGHDPDTGAQHSLTPDLSFKAFPKPQGRTCAMGRVPVPFLGQWQRGTLELAFGALRPCAGNGYQPGAPPSGRQEGHPSACATGTSQIPTPSVQAGVTCPGDPGSPTADIGMWWGQPRA